MNKWLDSVALKILAHVRERKSISFYSRKIKVGNCTACKAIQELHAQGLLKKIKKGREYQIELTQIGQVAQDQLWALNRLLR